MSEETETPKPTAVAGRLDGLVSFHLDWYPNTVKPSVEGDYILYNKCDGFHIAESTLDDDGSVSGLHFFGGKDVQVDFYSAWALLPTTAYLYLRFVRANAELRREE